MAEHREITRIPNGIARGQLLVHANAIPALFVMGPGHVRFFYDKLLFLQKRYASLYDECQHRGYNVTAKHTAFEGLPTELMNDYEPTDYDRLITLERLYEKVYL
jgi:hypothetical protein